ncbi:hypothetical protein D3C87_1948030 [compost metagenome]
MEATDSASPNRMDPNRPQPRRRPSPMPSRVANPICTMAPGMASARTLIRSFNEKCRPTPNIRRMTPSSASSAPSSRSATKPGE